MPRAYRLGRRADQQLDTRRRILAAAIELYGERGYAGTTIRAVADAADVVPGTVRNHFPTPLALAEAAGEQALTDLQPPDASILEGLSTIPERVERAARELISFFARGEKWWSILQRDPELARAWGAAADAYEHGFQRLLRTALGELADDPAAMAIATTTVGPPLHYALRGAGLSAAAAVDAQVEVIVPWLERRADALYRRSTEGPPGSRRRGRDTTAP
jgi:AcrR family transcriptional regulator